MIDKNYAEEIREGLSARAFEDEATFRAETQKDVNAGYYDEVEHVGRELFGRGFWVKRPGKRAGHDFPCALHRGPAGDCNEHNCRCA